MSSRPQQTPTSGRLTCTTCDPDGINRDYKRSSALAKHVLLAHEADLVNELSDASFQLNSWGYGYCRPPCGKVVKLKTSAAQSPSVHSGLANVVYHKCGNHTSASATKRAAIALHNELTQEEEREDFVSNYSRIVLQNEGRFPDKSEKDAAWDAQRADAAPLVDEDEEHSPAPRAQQHDDPPLEAPPPDLNTRGQWAAYTLAALHNLATSLSDSSGPATAEQCSALTALARLGSRTALRRQGGQRGTADPEGHHSDGDAHVLTTRSHTSHTPDQRTLNLRDAIAALGRGCVSQASRILGSRGTADLSDPAVETALRAKYPRRDAPVDTTVLELGHDGLDESLEPFSGEAAIKYIASRRRGTAGGPEGLSYNDVKELLGHSRRGQPDDAPNPAGEALGHILTAIAHGRFNSSPDVCSELTEGSGTALRKSDTDMTAVRPISSTEILPRMASGLLARRHMSEALQLSNEHQLCGAHAGADKTAAAIGIYWALHGHEGGVVASVDVSNAFNTVSKQCLLDAAARIPGLRPYAQGFIAGASRITYKSKARDPRNYRIEIVAEEGGRQGDPMMSLLFGVAQEETVKHAMERHDKECLRVAYADNMYFGAPSFAAWLAAYDDLWPALAKAGMELGKKEVLVRRQLTADEAAQCEKRGITVLHDGLLVVGVPVGTREFVKKMATDQIESAIHDALTDARDMHAQAGSGGGGALQAITAWLRYQIAGRATHLLRAVDPSLIEEALSALDAEVAHTVLGLTCGSAPPTSKPSDGGNGRDQALLDAPSARITWPVADGGLGFCSLAVTSIAGYVGGLSAALGTAGRLLGGASALGVDTGDPDAPPPPWAEPFVAAAARLANLSPELSKLIKAEHGLSTVVGRTEDFPRAQAVLTELITSDRVDHQRRQILEILQQTGGLECRAAADAITAAGTRNGGGSIAGAWVSAPPWAPGCHMSDGVYRAAMSARLGLPLPGLSRASRSAPQDGDVTCVCGGAADTQGSHARVCPSNKGPRSTQHALYLRALRDGVRELGFAATLEPGASVHYPRSEEFTAEALAAAAAAATRRGARGGVELSSEHTRGDLAIFLPNHGGQPTFVDTVLVATTSGARGAKPLTTKDILRQLENAEKTKVARYKDWPIPADKLAPFAASLGGPLGKKALALLGRLAELGTRSGDSLTAYASTAGTRKRALTTRLSVALQCTNAATGNRWLTRCMRPGEATEEEAAAAAPQAPQARARGRNGRTRADTAAAELWAMDAALRRGDADADGDAQEGARPAEAEDAEDADDSGRMDGARAGTPWAEGDPILSGAEDGGDGSDGGNVRVLSDATSASWDEGPSAVGDATAAGTRVQLGGSGDGGVDGGGAESEDAEDWRPAHPAGDAVRPDGGGEDDDAYVSCESSSDDE